MTGEDGLRFIEGMLDLAPYALTGVERLADLGAWDSLSTILFIATVDKKFGLPLSGNLVTRCQTVDDLCALLGDAEAAPVA
jgi:acyl carrier protein